MLVSSLHRHLNLIPYALISHALFLGFNKNLYLLPFLRCKELAFILFPYPGHGKGGIKMILLHSCQEVWVTLDSLIILSWTMCSLHFNNSTHNIYYAFSKDATASSTGCSLIRSTGMKSSRCPGCEESEGESEESPSPNVKEQLALSLESEKRSSMEFYG